jgi:hypothetical protein
MPIESRLDRLWEARERSLMRLVDEVRQTVQMWRDHPLGAPLMDFDMINQEIERIQPSGEHLLSIREH